MRTLSRGLRNDRGSDIITIYTMIGIPIMLLVIIPLLIWLKGLEVARAGTERLAQQAALAAASQVKVEEIPGTGEKVLRIDPDAARRAAIDYYTTQTPYVRDMFNYPVIALPGKKHASETNGDFDGSGCSAYDAYGFCVGFLVAVDDYYSGSLMSFWLLQDVPLKGFGYAELSANNEKCNPDQAFDC